MFWYMDLTDISLFLLNINEVEIFWNFLLLYPCLEYYSAFHF